jgi:hypothetical protein
MEDGTMSREHRRIRCLNPACGEIIDEVEVETTGSSYLPSLRTSDDGVIGWDEEGDAYVDCPHCGTRHRLLSGGDEAPAGWDFVLEKTQEIEEL